MKKLQATAFAFVCLLLAGCNTMPKTEKESAFGQMTSMEETSSVDKNDPSTHICQHVPFEKEPTCQEEGYSIIACTYCLAEYEQFRVVYPKVVCKYGEDGKCVWCQSEVEACEECQAAEFYYRGDYGTYLCDGCYTAFSESGLQACCICGSYRCAGHEE